MRPTPRIDPDQVMAQDAWQDHAADMARDDLYLRDLRAALIRRQKRRQWWAKAWSPLLIAANLAYMLISFLFFIPPAASAVIVAVYFGIIINGAYWLVREANDAIDKLELLASRSVLQ